MTIAVMLYVRVWEQWWATPTSVNHTARFRSTFIFQSVYSNLLSYDGREGWSSFSATMPELKRWWRDDDMMRSYDGQSQTHCAFTGIDWPLTLRWRLSTSWKQHSSKGKATPTATPTAGAYFIYKLVTTACPSRPSGKLADGRHYRWIKIDR